MTALQGRLAVVAGASRGIGAAVAAALAAEGARVVRLSRRCSDAPLAGLAPGGTADRRCDVTREADVTRLRDDVQAALGTPDLLVHAAGAFLLRPAHEISAEEFRGQVEANLVGPFVFVRTFLPGLRAARRGHVVLIGSIADHRVLPGNAAYGAGKVGLRGLHDVLVTELAGTGVRASLVSPGPTDTPLWDPLDPDGRPDLPDRAAMLRPADVADAVRYVVTRPPSVHVEWLRVMPA